MVFCKTYTLENYQTNQIYIYFNVTVLYRG